MVNHNLKQYHPEVLDPPTAEDKQKAKDLHKSILSMMDSVKADEQKLSKNYVALGKMVYEVQKNTYWSILGYNSWKEYWNFLEDQFGKGRTQLYGYVSTVRTLSEHVDDQTLLDMGINKSSELRKAVQTTGKKPSNELLDKGRDPDTTVSDFREAIHKEFNVQDHNEKGVWTDVGGFYFTDGEQDEFNRAVKLAKSIDPQIPKALPEHVQMREVILRWVREFISEYEWKANQNPDGFNQVFQEVNG